MLTKKLWYGLRGDWKTRSILYYAREDIRKKSKGHYVGWFLFGFPILIYCTGPA